MVKVKKSLLDKFLFIGVLVSTLFTYLLGDIFYNSVGSPDFYRYSKYFKYFFGDVGSVELEQGLIYYYLNSLIISTRYKSLNNFYFEEVISQSIQFTNFSIYLVALCGVYKLLSVRNVEKKHIYFILIIINFFPPLLALRLIFKPEILILTLFIWSLVTLELNKLYQNTVYLFYFVLIFSLLSSIKATGTLIAGVALLFLYFDVFKKIDIKFFILLFFIYLLLLSLVSYENFLANGLLFFEHKTTENYLFNAEKSFIYNFDFQLFLDQPKRHSQNNSLIGIVLLETFDDYFTIYWNNDTSLFFQDRINILHPYSRQYFSVLLTITFYFLIFYKSLKSTQNRKFVISPLIGLIIMLFVSLFIQFDPNTGDMMKNYYYSFLLLISFIFILIELLPRLKDPPNLLFSFLFVFSSLFLIGFPKEQTENFEIKYTQNLSTAYYCELYSNISSTKSNCYKPELDFCEFHFLEKEKVLPVNGELIQSKVENKFALLKNTEPHLGTYESCIKDLNTTLSLNKSNYKIHNTPYINIIFYITFIFLTIDMFFRKQSKNHIY